MKKYLFTKNYQLKDLSLIFSLILFTYFLNIPLYAVIRLHDIEDSHYIELSKNSSFLPVGCIMRPEPLSEKNIDEETPSIIKQDQKILLPCGTATLIGIPGRKELDGFIILTAAHVLKNNVENYFYLNAQEYRIKKFFRPSKYAADSDLYDIAIGVLAERINNVKPAIIFSDNSEIDDIYLHVLTTVGYGASGRGDVNVIYDDGKKRAFHRIVSPYKVNIGEENESFDFAQRSLFVTKFIKPRPSKGAIFVKELKEGNILTIYDYSTQNATNIKALSGIGLTKEEIFEIEERISQNISFKLKNYRSLYNIEFVSFPIQFLLGGSSLGYSGAPDFIEWNDNFYIISINLSNQEGLVKDVKYLIPSGGRSRFQDYYYPSAIEAQNVIKIRGAYNENFTDALYMDKVLLSYKSRTDNQFLYNAEDIHLFLPAVRDWLNRVFSKL